MHFYSCPKQPAIKRFSTCSTKVLSKARTTLQQRLERKGFEVGQATLSRDIHELKLVKGPEGYRRAGESVGAEGVLPSVMHLARQFVVEIRQAQNLLVVKTTVGSAQPVAAALDARVGPKWWARLPATIPCWSSPPIRKKRRRSLDAFAIGISTSAEHEKRICRQRHSKMEFTKQQMRQKHGTD